MTHDVSLSDVVKPILPTTGGAEFSALARRSAYFASDGWEPE
jgi:hypothetical protein